ncbi:hypothetical protein FB451DRAFT_1303467 [Mycena latifolia]|nr:hypothetical protein FB451DRAFT_1303467 [Mycena latifolia]
MTSTARAEEPDSEVIMRILAEINVTRSEPATCTCTKYFKVKLPKNPHTLEAILDKIDELEFRSMLRVSIDSEHLRIKMHVPGSTHGRAAGLGNFILGAGQALNNTFMRHLFTSGAGEQLHGNYRKQPDWSAYPVARPSKMPSIVIEIGVSEAINDLQDDARQWLNDFGPQVLTVVLVKIRPGTKTLLLDMSIGVWNRDPITSTPRCARGPWTYYQTPAPPPANLVLDDTDLFLPTEMPLFIAGRQIVIQGADIQFWVDQVLGV